MRVFLFVLVGPGASLRETLRTHSDVRRFVMEIDILGVDLAKQIFQLHGADCRDRVVHRSKVLRSFFSETARTLNPKMVVMEAYRTVHHWARCLQSIGPKFGESVRNILYRSSRQVRTIATMRRR